MLELLKRGAKPTDDMIHQSKVVRMCALGLVNLKGCQSVAAAAAMMVCACLHRASCQNALNLNKYLSISCL